LELPSIYGIAGCIITSPVNHTFLNRKTKGSDMPDLGEINVIALCKGVERYIFLYDDRNRLNILRQFGLFAADAELSFNWHDAATLAGRVYKPSEVTQCRG
jgi:hypothetical protein